MSAMETEIVEESALDEMQALFEALEEAENDMVSRNTGDLSQVYRATFPTAPN